LTDELGFKLTSQDGSRFRYQISTAEDNGNNDKDYQGSNIVDVLWLPNTQYGMMGVGTVHHVAWRTPTDEQQKVLRNRIIKAGLNATPVIDVPIFTQFISVSQVEYCLKLLQIH
jgi:glyoxalase family protein